MFTQSRKILKQTRRAMNFIQNDEFILMFSEIGLVLSLNNMLVP